MTQTGQPVIQARGLVKTFKAKKAPVEAVKGIDLEVGRGEIFGFLGPNGAGKSTTINILCTLMRPTSGRAAVAGFDVDSAPDEVRSRIGLVFQDPSLDQNLTARENLQFHAFIYSVPSAQRRERIDGVLRMVELLDRADTVVKTFSGGMRRRLEIARGMLHTPEVLFLDEPTIGLDPQTRRHIWEYLRRLREEHSVTLFMTTHYMDEAEECDRIAVIDYGKIVGEGTPTELKRLVGGDVVTISTSDNVAAAAEIRERFDMEPTVDDGTLRLEVPDGAEFIPRLVRELTEPVTSVASHRPSLDDVFLKLTGHAIREEPIGAAEKMRLSRQVWGRQR